MQKFYTLSASAGLIRSNKFEDKADAVCVGTFRAQELALPVKVYEHDEEKEVKCVLVCMPDGSAKKPKGELVEVEEEEAQNETAGRRNMDEAHMLLSAYDEMPITTFYLKSDMPESLASQIEKECEVEVGLYDPKTLHAYTEDSDKLKKLETKLAEASVEIEKVRDSKIRKERLEAAADLVEAARKGHLEARKSRMPEISVRASLRSGSGVRIQCHCEMVQASGDQPPKIRVYADGRAVGEVRSEREAAQIMSDYALRSFSKFLKKQLG